VPATVFVAAGPGGREREFWWDELEALLLRRPEVPATLTLQIAGTQHSFDLGTGAFATPGSARAHPGWAFDETLAATEPRIAAFRALYDLLQPMPGDAQAEVMDQLCRWSGAEAAVRESRRAMNPGELSQLECGGLVEVGAHTWSHPRLSAHPDETQRREMARGRQTLEEWLGHRIAGFAYPYGAYSESSVAIAREMGFDFACSCEWGPVVRGADPMLLPRLELPDPDPEALERRLVHFFGRA
jgi:peptidoglycan/xylan/chitin deacetylase (PgdA/CDA1 family)